MSPLGHLVWFVLTLLTGMLALPFWILAAVCCGSSRRKRDDRRKDEQIELLRQLVSEKTRERK